MRNTHRIFVAIPTSPDVRKKLLNAVAEWQELPVRWTKPEQMHVTVLFIGTVDDEELARIASVLPLAVEGLKSFEITLNRIGIGPTMRQPRMVWAEGEASPMLLELQRHIEETVFGEHPIPQESDEVDESDSVTRESLIVHRKSFRLHITLGRVIPFQWKKLGTAAPKMEKPINISFPATSIELMESEAGPGGPRYTVLSSISLNE